MTKTPIYKTELIKFLPTQQSFEAFANSKEGQRLINGFARCLTWLHLLGKTFGNHPANILLASIHSKILEFWVLVPLRLTHSASGSLRTITDLIFSYSYYVYHPKEWDAIFSGRAEWEGRAGILDWHIRITLNFQEYNKKFGLLKMLDDLNRDLSYFVHGIPATGLPMTYSLNREELDKTDIMPVIELSERVDSSLNCFLIGVFYQFLPILSSDDHKLLLAGINKRKLAECGIYISSV